jgi:hypothetical protein
MLANVQVLSCFECLTTRAPGFRFYASKEILERVPLVPGHVVLFEGFHISPP